MPIQQVNHIIFFILFSFENSYNTIQLIFGMATIGVNNGLTSFLHVANISFKYGRRQLVPYSLQIFL